MAKRVKQETAIPGPDGFGVMLDPVTKYADNHPYVKAYPDLFVEAYDDSDVVEAPHATRAKKDVEQATAAPGEKR